MKTKGNIIVENIQIGDIHYEYGPFKEELKVEVATKPVKDGDYWTWQSRDVETGQVIDYLVTEGYAHYGPELYDYQAYIRK